MVDTSTEAVTELLDGVTPGPWKSDNGDGFSANAVKAVRPFNKYPVTIAHAVGDSAEAEFNMDFIAAARDLVPALLAERDALRRENENLRQIERNVQAVREHEYKRAEAALAEVERLKSQEVTVQDAARVLLDWWHQLEPDTCAIVAEAKRVMGVMSALSEYSEDGFSAFDAALRAIAESKA